MREKFDFKIYNWSIDDGDYERSDIEEESFFSLVKEQIYSNAVYILFFLAILIIGILFTTDTL